MSDTMFYGVLRMPYEMAMSNELSRRQFYSRAQDAADRVEAADKRITELESRPAAPVVAEGWQAGEPPQDAQFLAYHPSLVHEDFNPLGVVEACFNGEEFIGAVWNGTHDCWDTLPIEIERWRFIDNPLAAHPVAGSPASEAPADLPNDWKDRLYAAMDAEFELYENGPRDNDGHRQGMRNDDTQVGVEFAMKWLESAAAPVPASEAAQDEADALADLRKAVIDGASDEWIMGFVRQYPFKPLAAPAAPTDAGTCQACPRDTPYGPAICFACAEADENTPTDAGIPISDEREAAYEAFLRDPGDGEWSTRLIWNAAWQARGQQQAGDKGESNV